MSSWRLTFPQRKANNGAYGGDRFPEQIWDWPQGSWFQEPLRYLRETQRQTPQRIDR